MTNQRLNILGGLLKRIDNFDMESFENRLLLQKRTYFLQNFDLYLGYTYSWYIYGPYSVGLARDGYSLAPIFQNIPEVKFVKEEHEQKFKNFMNFLGDRKSDTNWLECLASMHFLSKIYPSLTKHDITDKVMHKQTYFSKKYCEEAWAYLRVHGLLSGRK